MEEKPKCPFCGSEIIAYRYSGIIAEAWRVYCCDCGAVGPKRIKKTEALAAFCLPWADTGRMLDEMSAAGMTPDILEIETDSGEKESVCKIPDMFEFSRGNIHIAVKAAYDHAKAQGWL